MNLMIYTYNLYQKAMLENSQHPLSTGSEVKSLSLCSHQQAHFAVTIGLTVSLRDEKSKFVETPGEARDFQVWTM